MPGKLLKCGGQRRNKLLMAVLDQEAVVRFVGSSAAIAFWLALMLPAKAGGFLESITKSINPGQVGVAIDKATNDVGKANAKAAQDVSKAIEKAAKDNPEDTSKLMEKVMAARATESVLTQLTKLPLDKLYALKVSPDICASGTVSCEVLSNDRVRQFLDIEIDRRKANLDSEDKTRTLNLLRIDGHL